MDGWLMVSSNSQEAMEYIYMRSITRKLIILMKPKIINNISIDDLAS